MGAPCEYGPRGRIPSGYRGTPFCGGGGGTGSLSLNIWPNPSPGVVHVHFYLPASGFARLGVYDLTGRLVRVLCQEVLPAEVHERVWDGNSESGTRLAPGVYLLRLEAGSRVESRVITRIQ